MMRTSGLLVVSLSLTLSVPGPSLVHSSRRSKSSRRSTEAKAKAPEKLKDRQEEADLPEPSPYPLLEPCSAPPTDMACIPGGEFIRGVNQRRSNAHPAETVWLQTFYMDKFHVTYEQYQTCVKEGKCQPARPTYPDFNHPRQPMTKVSYYDALNYCKAHGKHLPTEAQWEKAARGTDGRTYPWGNEPITCKRAIFFDQQGRSCGVKQRSREPDKGKPWDVGSRPPGVYGLYDMSGNSWAWVLDSYSSSYADCGKDCEGVDPKGPCQGEEPCPGHKLHIVRGGSWYWGPSMATTYYRRAVTPINGHHFGFRCAASVQEAASLEQADVAGSDRRAKAAQGSPVSAREG